MTLLRRNPICIILLLPLLIYFMTEGQWIPNDLKPGLGLFLSFAVGAISLIIVAIVSIPYK